MFSGATTYTCLLFLNKEITSDTKFTKVKDINNWRISRKAEFGLIPSSKVTEAVWNFNVGEGSHLVEKLSCMPAKLGNISNIFVGLQTSADDVFIMDLIENSSETITLKSKALEKVCIFEKGLFHPLVSGTDVNRYIELSERQYILFPYKIVKESVTLIDFFDILREYPMTAAYLQENKKRLEGREKDRMKGSKWYGYIYLKNMKLQSIPKLCIPRLVDRLYATYDINGNHFLDNVDVGGIILDNVYQQLGFEYLLGLLNSKLLRWYFPFISAPFRGGWFSANCQFISQLPIRLIDFSEKNDIKYHSELISKVIIMLKLNHSLTTSDTQSDKQMYQGMIDTTDKEIDELVYELYGLTKEEINIVEQDAI